MSKTILDVADAAWKGTASPNEVKAFPAEELQEVAPGVGMMSGFGHAFAIDTGEGAVLFDTGGRDTAESLFKGVRSWSDEPVTHAVYSHGHIDHIGGVPPFDRDADDRGVPRPQVIAHANILRRFARYDSTRGYNTVINQRQFRAPDFQWPDSYRHPDVTISDEFELVAGDLTLHLRHAKGETDDHLYGYDANRRMLFTGDMFIWVSPNAGNPQKVQRYPVEWAEALREMEALDAELLLPSHGVPIVGADRVRQALGDTARYLETLIEQTLEILNTGGTVLQAIHEVRVPEDLAAKPYLQPVYDEPEFIVRNIWRMYGGWYDGDPANLKPAPQAALASELATLAGGATKFASRAAELAASGNYRLATHLVQLAGLAAPEDRGVQRIRAEVLTQRSKQERSTMSRGIYSWAAAESQAALSGATLREALSATTSKAANL